MIKQAIYYKDMLREMRGEPNEEKPFVNLEYFQTDGKFVEQEVQLTGQIDWMFQKLIIDVKPLQQKSNHELTRIRIFNIVGFNGRKVAI